MPYDPFDAPIADDTSSPRDPLLLVADPLLAGREWTRLRALLTPGFAVLELGPDGGGSLEAEATALTGRLLASDAYPVHVLAFSLGAATAVALAERRPDLLRSLVLVEPLAGVPGAELLGLFDSGSRPAEPPAYPPLLGEERGAGENSPAPTAFSSSAIDRARRRASEVSADPHGPEEVLAPVLTVVGAEVPSRLRSIAAACARRFPNSSELIVPGAGARLPWVDPPRLAGILGTFCLERNVPTA